MGTSRDDPRVAFFLREFEGRPEAEPASGELSADEQTLIDLLARTGGELRDRSGPARRDRALARAAEHWAS